METYNPYWFLAVFALAAAGFGLGPILLAKAWARWFAPPKPGPIKNAIYECGLETKGAAGIQFKVEYYLYAILFLIFDVEIISSCHLRWRSPNCRWAPAWQCWFFCCFWPRVWFGLGPKGC